MMNNIFQVLLATVASAQTAGNIARYIGTADCEASNGMRSS
jgi:hypothetical protein